MPGYVVTNKDLYGTVENMMAEYRRMVADAPRPEPQPYGPWFAPSYKRFVNGELVEWCTELHKAHDEGYITLPSGYFPWIK